MNWELRWVWTSFFVEFVFCDVFGYNFDADDSVHYQIDWKPYTQMPEFLRSLEPGLSTLNSVVFMSSEDKKYVCEVPNTNKKIQKEATSYSGPSPAELIEPLYKNRICSYWLDVYWTYELCHGRYVLQFHEDKETNRRARTEYYLGNYARDQNKPEEQSAKQDSFPLRKIDDYDLPYFAVSYKHGTVCDVTGKSRTTNVIYVCKEGGKDGIYAFAETSSCNYEMVVLTERLCAHPTFKPPAKPELEINCYSRDPTNATFKPLSLLKLEEEAATAFEREYSILPSESVDGNVFPKFLRDSTSAVTKDKTMHFSRNEKKVSVTKDEDEDDDDAVVIKEIYPSTSKKKIKKLEETNNNEGPGRDVQAIYIENQGYFSGRTCFFGGGTGWWKYEFCYGKSVTQFHEDQKSPRIEILLGSFNEEIQKLWIEQNPQKQPQKVDGKVREVYHVYSGGDVCEEEKIRRSVEVRVRCVSSLRSKTAVSLSLTEPRKCQYILQVESPRFCEFLQQVDKYGLFKLPDLSSAVKEKGSSTLINEHIEL